MLPVATRIEERWLVAVLMRPIVWIASVFLVAGSASAQTIYRCGSNYQDHPCPGAAVVDATPNTGVEVRGGPKGAVVHSPSGDKARNQRTMEQMHENLHNAMICGSALDPMTVKDNRIDCPTAKAQADAKRLTPDYIKK